MSFKHTTTNIYLSYAYVDNQNFVDDDKGWISAFKDDLENELSFLMGKITPVTIFHNKQFESPNLLTIKYIRTTDIFVVIGTPAYYLSDFCQKEMKLFLKRNDVDPYQRIFLVERKPFDDNSIQRSIPFKHSFLFYEAEKENGWSRKVEKGKYFGQIAQLAQKIYEQLS